MSTGRALAAAAVVAAGLVAAACTSSGDAGGGQAGGADSSGSEGGGGTGPSQLTVAVRQDFGPLNIFAQHEEPLTELVYDKLLAPSPYVEDPQPWLAESVERRDASTWEVSLRDDVTWHDGEAFTSADVAFTVNFFKQAPTGRWTHHVAEVPEIARVETPDEQTAVFQCASACPFLGRITLADLPMIPEHIWRGVGAPEQVTDPPVGTGPYELTSYNSTDGYRFTANPDYFAGQPKVDELVMPIIADPSTTFTALRTGELDAAARTVSPELVEQFRANPDIRVKATGGLQFPALQMNFERAPFDQAGFRRALSRAVDRQALLETVILGQGRPATQGYPHPDSPWTAPDLSMSYEPQTARELLDQLGFTDTDGDGTRERTDGTPLAFTIKVNGSEPAHIRAAGLLAEQFGEVGLDVTVRQLDAGAMGELFSSRNFDAYLASAPVHGVADPTQFVMSHRSGYLWDLPEVAYPEFSELIADWKAAATIEARTDELFAMQRLFNQQPTAIPVYYPDQSWAYRPGAYDGWVESPGYGIIHKWSLLPRDVAEDANALSTVG